MTNPDRRYVIEFSAALTAYMVVLVGSVTLLGHYGDTIWRIPLALAPMIPAIGALIAFLRFFRSIDEMQRRIQLDALAFGFGATAVLTFGYGFLEGAGFPHLNWTFVWPVMATSWGVGGILARRKYS